MHELNHILVYMLDKVMLNIFFSTKDIAMILIISILRNNKMS
jgi:hypothetical protein